MARYGYNDQKKTKKQQQQQQQNKKRRRRGKCVTLCFIVNALTKVRSGFKTVTMFGSVGIV